MKALLKNPFLLVAITLSVIIHGIVLGVHFVHPDVNKSSSKDEGLEVILVNAKHDKAPLKADALAQSDLDGGGQADKGRATSPLPDMQHISDGTDVSDNQHQVAQLEALQRQMLQELQKQTVITSQKSNDKVMPQGNKNTHAESSQSSSEPLATAMARMEAEINKNIQAYNKRPKKTQVTPSAKAVGYAVYYKKMQEKIERIGTRYFPEAAGKKLYGELLISIPVFQDGTIYRDEGGVKIEESSGNPRLDRAAIAIVEKAAPFERLPKNMLTAGKNDVWEIITRFRFTHDEILSAELHGN